MATETQRKTFVNEIAPIAQKAYKQFGKPLPSICIAMAAVESAWGTTGSCKYNSYLGQKVGTGKTATTYWGGKSFNSKTQEVTDQAAGTLTSIKANFRAYDSMEQCVYNYYELLNTSLYKKVLATSSYKDQMQQIKTCGYMTSVTEVNTCLSIISQYSLTQYDDSENINPYMEPKITILYGSRGEGAKWVQWYLHKMRLLSESDIDGIIGKKSLSAIKFAQDKLGLTVDGKVGEKTRAAFKQKFKLVMESNI